MSGLYDAGRAAFGNAGINWPADTIKAVIVDAADYTVNLATHDFLNDVPAGARVATATLTGKTNVGGVMDATDTPFTAVTGDPSEAIILYKETGVESTSALIAYIDQGTGFAIVPNGGDIVVVWPSTANKIFKL